MNDEFLNLTNKIKELQDNYKDITEDDEINKNELNNIKNDINSLQKELKDLVLEIRNDRNIQTARNNIDKNKNELDKKFYKHNLIRKRIIELTHDNTKVLEKEEHSNLNLPTFYLYYILLAVNALNKNDKKAYNNAEKQAIKLNEMDTYIALSLCNLELNYKEEAITYLKKYLDMINPYSIDNANSRMLEELIYIDDFKRIIFSYFDKCVEKLKNDENINNKISKVLNKAILKYKYEIKEDEYKYIKEYCTTSDELLNHLSTTYSYKEIYNIVTTSNYRQIGKRNPLGVIIYRYTDAEKELQNNILDNMSTIIGKNMKEKETIDDILTMFLKILFNDNKDIELKKVSLHYLKEYFINTIDDKPVNNYILKINEWTNENIYPDTRDKLNESLISYVKKPFEDEFNKHKLLNSKSIYSFCFAIIGIIVSIFNSTIGITMFVVGILSCAYFIAEPIISKKEIKNIYNNTLNEYLFILNTTLDEIDNVNNEIEINNTYKENLINYLKKL